MVKRKIEDSNSLLHLLRKGDYTKVIKITDKSISYYERELGMAKIFKSRALRIQGRHREALRLLSAVENSADTSVQASCFLEYGDLKLDVCINEQDAKNREKLLEQAHSMFNKALIAARDCEHASLGLQVNRRIAFILYETQRYSQAIKNSLAILESLTEYGDKAEEARTKMQLAKLLSRQNDFPQAEKYAQEALLTSKIRQDPREIAHSYLVIAELGELKEEWGLALKNYRTALQMFENIGEKAGFDFAESRMVVIEEKMNAVEE